MICIPVPTFPVYSVLIWRTWVTFSLGLGILHTVSQTCEGKIPKTIKLMCPYIKPKFLFMNNQSVETTYNSRFRLAPWIQFGLSVMSIMCCLFFLTGPQEAPESSQEGAWQLSCSVYFCDDIFICHRCTARQWTPMSLDESDNFPSPFPFTLANFCILELLQDRFKGQNSSLHCK